MEEEREKGLGGGTGGAGRIISGLEASLDEDFPVRGKVSFPLIRRLFLRLFWAHFQVLLFKTSGRLLLRIFIRKGEKARERGVYNNDS